MHFLTPMAGYVKLDDQPKARKGNKVSINITRNQ
jgi:hypothetical protein